MIKKVKEPEHDEQIKLLDPIVQQAIVNDVSNVIEGKLERRISRNARLLEAAFLLIAAILLPSGWFTIKALVSNAIEQQSQRFSESLNDLKKIGEKNNELIRKKIDLQLKFLTIENTLSMRTVNPFIDKNTAEQLVNDLIAYADNNPGYGKIIHKQIRWAAELMMLNNYNYLLERLNKRFKERLDQSRKVNVARVNYYGLQILSLSIPPENIRKIDIYQKFEEALIFVNAQEYEAQALPMATMVSFYMNNNIRNNQTTKLVNLVQEMSVDNRAEFLWSVIKRTKPEFWTTAPTPADHRISETVNKFSITYKEELLLIADKSGVKDALLKKYYYSTTPLDIRLGKYIINYLYSLEV